MPREGSVGDADLDEHRKDSAYSRKNGHCGERDPDGVSGDSMSRLVGYFAAEDGGEQSDDERRPSEEDSRRSFRAKHAREQGEWAKRE